MRLLDYAILFLRSTDRRMPEVRRYGVPGLAALSEQLRECVLRERESRGVKVWTQT